MHERDKLGLPRNSTDFFGFGPTERADFDSDEWVPDGSESDESMDSCDEEEEDLLECLRD